MASEENCESCIYYPPSWFGGKPCLTCNQDDPIWNSYQRRVSPPPTNADRIRTMSDEELAEAIAQQMVELVCRVASNFACDIGAEKQFLLEQNKTDWLQWLQSPADGGDGDG